MVNSSATNRFSPTLTKVLSGFQRLNLFSEFTKATFNKPMLTSLGLHVVVVFLMMGAAFYQQSQVSLSPLIDIEMVDIEFTSDDQDLSSVRQKQLAKPQVSSTEIAKVKPANLNEEILSKTAKESQFTEKADSLTSESTSQITSEGTSEKTIDTDSETGSSQKQKLKMSYEQYLVSYITQYKTYPRVAFRLKQEGLVYPQLKISKEGQLKAIVISKSSGFLSLDQGAISLIKSLAPFKPLPQNLNDEFTITIPIEYTIKGS